MKGYESRRKRIGLKTTLIATVVILAMLGIAFVILSNRHVNVKKSTFLEAADISWPFTEEESVNIRKYLAFMQIQGGDQSGFSSGAGGGSSLDLYNANAVVSLAEMIPGYDLSELRERMSFLRTVDSESLDFLNLTYLANIGNRLGFDLDYKRLNDALAKFYDEKTGLFFLFNEDDGIHIELVATINAVRAFDDNLDENRFHVVDGAKTALSDYSFSTDSSNTMYNSGGDMLCLLGELGLQTMVDESKVAEWISYWECAFDKIEIKTLSDALAFSSFAEVEQCFNPEFGREKIYRYYCGLDRKQLSEMDDVLMLSDVLKKGKTLDDQSVNEALREKLAGLMNKLASSEIDVRSTAFGVMLAEKVGFDYDKDSVRKYVKSNYDTYHEKSNLYDRVGMLYYNIMLDQLVNGYDQDYNGAFFQKQIDALLSELEYGKNNMAADISSARRIVEIVSDLRTFGVDVDLNYRQKNKLRKMIKAFYRNDELRETALIIDAYIIDDALSLGIIKESDVGKTYTKLAVEGGARQYCSEETQADVCTTYLFFAMLNRLNDYSYVQTQRQFIQSTMVEEGIFSYYRDNGFIDLGTIAYGNSVFGYVNGGDSRDKGRQ